jgi:hypothetical protein
MLLYNHILLRTTAFSFEATILFSGCLRPKCGYNHTYASTPNFFGG